MKTETQSFSPTTLKSLSIRECIKLARFLYPQYTWHYFSPYPDDEWDGHDIVSGTPIGICSRKYPQSISIDYREDITSERPRVIFKRLNGEQEIPDELLIINFFISIGKIK